MSSLRICWLISYLQHHAHEYEERAEKLAHGNGKGRSNLSRRFNVASRPDCSPPLQCLSSGRAGEVLSGSPLAAFLESPSEHVPVGRRRPRHGALVRGRVARRALRREQRVAAGHVWRRRGAAPRPRLAAAAAPAAAAERRPDGVVVEVDVALGVDRLVGRGAHELRAQVVLAAAAMGRISV